jgi:hypothetical protein
MAVAALAVLGIGLRVIAEGACPSAAAVQAQLQPLLPNLSELDGMSAHIEPLDELLRVEVRSDTGGLLSVRDLDRSAPCPALAAAAAVVIASAVASLPRPAPELPMERPLPAPPPAVPPPPAPRPPPRLLWEIGAGGVLAVSSQAVTGGGTLELQLAPLGRRLSGRLGLRLSITGVGLRSESLEPFTQLSSTAVAWTRLQGLLLPRYRLLIGQKLIEAAGGLAAAAVLVQGSGFPRSYASQSADVGLAGDVRIGRVWQRLALWADFGFVGWLRPQDLSLYSPLQSPNPPLTRLPAWDILFSVGISFGRLSP